MGLKRHIPNAITSMNLLSGAMGVIFTLNGDLGTGFLLMLAGAVFDFCDGLAARLLKAYSPIGKELDSLSDMVTFGLLPSVMLYMTMRLTGQQEWLCFIPLILAVFSGLRLAKFNVDERQSTDFLGVATPTAAILCGSLTSLAEAHPEAFVARLCATPWFLPVLALVLSLLLVSEIPMFGMKIAKGHRLLVFLKADLRLAVLLVFTVYVTENLLIWGINSFRREA